MYNIAAAQTNSFNFAISEGLKYAVRNICPEVVETKNNPIIISVMEADIKKTSLPPKKTTCKHCPIYPSECRLHGHNYFGDMRVKIGFQGNDFGELCSERVFQVPIMVKSNVCILCSGRDSREEPCDPGGYFIINGKERFFRMYLVKHRNYPFGIIRSSWKKRKVADLFSSSNADCEENYTEFGVQIRSVSSDETNSTITLRYLDDASVNLCIVVEGYHYFVSLMLIFKALGNYSDKYIYQKLCDGRLDSFSKSCILNMLRKLQRQGIHSETQAKLCLATKFQNIIRKHNPREIADLVIKQCILIHLEDNEDKFNLLCFMLKKLLCLVQGKISPEQPTSFLYQELLLSGHLYLMLLKLELKRFLKSVKSVLEKKTKIIGDFILDQGISDYCTRRAIVLGSEIVHALSTGNIPASKLGLIQSTGCSILCERTNFLRFRSYYTRVDKAIIDPYNINHLRRLQPECWGYLCPTHTPDGKETGLTNHLTQSCLVTLHIKTNHNLVEVIFSIVGALHMSDADRTTDGYLVIVDGKVVAIVISTHATKFVNILKLYRSAGKVDKFTEIIFFPHQISNGKLFYPGIYIYTTPGRMVRPVENCSTGSVDYICVFEQAFLRISSPFVKVKRNDLHLYTHKELPFENLYSDIASLTPFFEFNASPRNIYSCQMAKHALGIPSHALFWRADTKLYQFMYPQIPMVTTLHYEENGYKEYPTGTNAVIAIISYSGYDMEDAIVLNKSAVERGLADACIFSTVIIDLQEKAKDMGLKHASAFKFGRTSELAYMYKSVDVDGLPYIGQRLNYGDVYCSYIETKTKRIHTELYLRNEPGYVHDVKLLGNYCTPMYLTKAMIQFRIPRRVEIGDKFASRHGQKGIVGYLWPEEDMPFSISGMVPDILVNPHSFPSRMTIGMFLESMAGVVASAESERSVIGQFQFTDKECSAPKYFSKKLEKAGFNLHGTETMYSGVSGEELTAHIFTGIVYYQRLRHMVADKYQMRSLGGKSFAFQQPVKGSSKDAAIRFGEMERDALMAHGAAYALHDRLMICSDLCVVYICSFCSTILSPILPKEEQSTEHRRPMQCTSCLRNDILQAELPFVYVALAAELASLNIRLTF